MKNKKKILKILICLIILLIGSCMIYLCTGNYNADEEIKKYLNSAETVDVSKIENGYFFDGPGENTAIIFYPGAKVEYTAYAKLMYQIAESGKDCFLIEMPFNMAFFGINKAQKIINEYNYENWYVSGHSMGGAMVCMYACDHPENVKGIIVMSAYPTKDVPSNMEYISIYGSEDQVLNKENYDNAKQYWPENSREYVIEGGSHAGFSNYGKQKGDGEAKITSNEQQKEVVNFLIENIESN